MKTRERGKKREVEKERERKRERERESVCLIEPRVFSQAITPRKSLKFALVDFLY